MKKIEIKGNKIIDRTKNNECTFEIVEKIPAGYFIWNIGENMKHEEYIPICEKLHKDDPKSFDINPETLKAIKLSKYEVQLLRKVGREGIINKEAAEKAIKSKRQSVRSKIKKAWAEKTIDIFNRITE